MRILLDMDGVLADFVGGMCKVHRRQDPFIIRDNHGIFDMASIWGINPRDFWKPTRGSEFWAELRPMDGFEELVYYCEDMVGIDNVCIVTSPSSDPTSVVGKVEWLNKHLPRYSRRAFFGSKKYFFACEQNILVDDWDYNVSKFCEYGGNAVLVPRLWNADHQLAERSLELTKARIKAYLR